MKYNTLKAFLDEKVEFYNRPEFIISDPVSVPHRYTQKEDIEIAGFLSATIAWGNRVSILKNGLRLMQLMDDCPFQFVMGAGEKELSQLNSFVHRTFNDTDCLFFVEALRNVYLNHGGLEVAFSNGLTKSDKDILPAIMHFRTAFLSAPHPERSIKHIANPAAGSTAKRINMFLRWMVRKDDKGVDFGIWNSLSPSQLCCPLDVHSGRSARQLGLLSRKQNDWKAVVELTENLRQFDAEDPVKYDYALFGMGVNDG